MHGRRSTWFVTLESFLDRLARTAHADDFVLMGGNSVGRLWVRRPTADTDSNAVRADVMAEPGSHRGGNHQLGPEGWMDCDMLLCRDV